MLLFSSNRIQSNNLRSITNIEAPQISEAKFVYEGELRFPHNYDIRNPIGSWVELSMAAEKARPVELFSDVGEAIGADASGPFAVGGAAH